MHGYPWYFRLLLEPTTWVVAAAVIVVIAWALLRKKGK